MQLTFVGQLTKPVTLADRLHPLFEPIVAELNRSSANSTAKVVVMGIGSHAASKQRFSGFAPDRVDPPAVRKCAQGPVHGGEANASTRGANLRVQILGAQEAVRSG